MGLVTHSNLLQQIHHPVDSDRSGEMSRLLNAALVDSQFCALLLTRPDQALAQGYDGRLFYLSSRDRQFILANRYTSLADLAERWISSCQADEDQPDAE